MSRFYLYQKNGRCQIISPLDQVVADVHGTATARGRAQIDAMLRALNEEPARIQILRKLRAQAEHLAESGQPTEDGFRQLATLVAELVQETARA
jgi:hypothetical protein